jgi:hypothetical protein
MSTQRESHTNTQDSPQTREKGILTQDGRQTHFIGSASGVYFLNKVRSLFGSSLIPDRGPVIDETIHGDEAESRRPEVSCDEIPPLELAEKLVMPYFRYFHPLVPFLNGKSVMQDLKLLCSGTSNLSFSRTAIVRGVISIGLLDYANMRAQFESLVLKIEEVSLLRGTDIETIQALLTVQVYLLATMAIRDSYEVSNVVRGRIFLSGLHRCPARYDFSANDCEQRKRILWSAYALERYLSQTLGLPIGIQDSDTDVCSLATERHFGDYDIPREAATRLQIQSPLRVGLTFAEYGYLIGWIIEIFNKSVHVRTVDPSEVLLLKAKVEEWWNQLPELDTPESPFENDCFFTVAYCHLQMLINRPRLSLDSTNPEFRYAIQVCIESSKNVLAAITSQMVDHPDQSLFWPGYLSTAWTAALMLAFAIRTGEYPAPKGFKEIESFVPLFDKMMQRWPSAKKCKEMLESFSEVLASSPEVHPPQKRTWEEANSDLYNDVFDLFNATWQWQDL